MKDKQEILILGAGVSGLSTGILLLKEGYSVHIWAKDLPPNTTSNIAAAFWYPYLCEPKDKVTKWSGFTLKYLKENVLGDPKAGCVMRTVTEIFDKKVAEPWWRDAVESYRRPTPEELPEGYIDGYQTEAVLMDTSLYIDWLLNQYKELGGTLEQKEIKDIQEALADCEIVVNCTGLGSRELFKDESVFPVRGQVVKVKPNGFDQVIADDEGPNNLAVLIPRINDTVLGGTVQPNNWSLDVDPKDTEDILRKAKALSPAFSNVEVIEEKVGLRPARKEVRLELEPYDGKFVVHNYGHGGAGFTLSWGCAEEVVELIKKAVAHANLPEPLLKALGITAELKVTHLPGNENDNYLVKTSDQSFVVKRLRAHSAANTELEAAYRDYLADSGLPVARYMPLGDNSYVLTLDGQDYVATPYVEGKMAVSHKETVIQAAALLAKTHKLDASGVPSRQSWYRKSYIPDSFELIDDKYAAVKKAFAKQYAQTTDFWDGRLPTGIIHGDLQGDNIIVNDQNRIVSIVDWEEAAVEPLLLDVAHSAQQLSSSNGVCDEALFTTFMETYQQVRPLSTLEKTLFDKALRYTMLVLSVWAHIKFSQNQLDEKTFERVGNYYQASYTIPPVN